jgi:hypothetical protein
MRALVAALLLAVSSAPAKNDGPVKRINRAKATGSPLLDLKTEEGIYIWFDQEGWFNIAAVSRAQKNQEMIVQIRSTKKITNVEGTFAVKAGDNSLSLRAWVGPLPVRGRFKTDGEVTVRSLHQQFVGPYSKKASSSISISRK